MLIEYKIKFEKDGLTIAQHIEPNSLQAVRGVKNGKVNVNGLPAAQHEVKALVARNPLAAGGEPADPIGGGGPADPIGGGGPADPIGGNVPGSAPIFILGPIVFGNSAPPEIARPIESTSSDATRKALGAAAGE
jgi:hypothetical protein